MDLDAFIAQKLAPFIGQNIDAVGGEMEDMVLGAGYWFRWLEPCEPVASERLPFRINVHVTKRHKIIKITAG